MEAASCSQAATCTTHRGTTSMTVGWTRHPLDHGRRAGFSQNHASGTLKNVTCGAGKRNVKPKVSLSVLWISVFAAHSGLAVGQHQKQSSGQNINLMFWAEWIVPSLFPVSRWFPGPRPWWWFLVKLMSELTVNGYSIQLVCNSNRSCRQEEMLSSTHKQHADCYTSAACKQDAGLELRG